jgi:hypothetical protein
LLLIPSRVKSTVPPAKSPGPGTAVESGPKGGIVWAIASLPARVAPAAAAVVRVVFVLFDMVFEPKSS